MGAHLPCLRHSHLFLPLPSAEALGYDLSSRRRDCYFRIHDFLAIARRYGARMRILPAWVREFVKVAADDRQLAEDLTSAGIAVESVAEEHGATIYEMDVTTNRVDAMNHYGVAREASAIYDVELKKVEINLPKPAGGTNFPIIIEDGKG